MPTISPTTESDFPHVESLLHRSYNRTNEVEFLRSIRTRDTFIPELSLAATEHGSVAGYILLTQVGIRTANEVLPTLVILPFCVDPSLRGKGIGSMLLANGMRRALQLGYSSCVSIHCGAYFERFGFLPARDEYGLEIYFQVPDGDFRACELVEDSLYRQSGFVIFPETFGMIDLAIVS